MKKKKKDQLIVKEDNNNITETERWSLYSSQSSLNEFSEMLREVQNSFLKNKWKVKVNAAKFQRQIDERYRYLLPLVKKYPELKEVAKYNHRD